MTWQSALIKELARIQAHQIDVLGTLGYHLDQTRSSISEKSFSSWVKKLRKAERDVVAHALVLFRYRTDKDLQRRVGAAEMTGETEDDEVRAVVAAMAFAGEQGRVMVEVARLVE